MPALILRGDLLKKSKHSIFEKIKPLWKILSFENKSIIRNIGRNKIRSIMVIVGVLGCMMLILAGLGMKNSMNYTIDSTYHDFYQYETKVLLNENVTEEIGVDQAFSQSIEEGTLEIKNNEVSKVLKYTVENEDKYLQLSDIKGHSFKMPEEGFVLSDEVASNLNLKVGSNFKFKKLGGSWQEGKVGAIMRITLPSNVIISKSYWENRGLTYKENDMLLGTEINPDSFNGLESVKEVISKESQIEALKDTFASADAVVYILILGAVVLGTIVIYNLGRLNYSERMRDYATLKVLGFYSGKIRLLSFRENSLLYVLGWLIGIPAGQLFLKIYMGVLSNDSIMFFPKIQLTSYVIASVITLVTAIGVNLILSLKINKIDMVTSLKSGE